MCRDHGNVMPLEQLWLELRAGGVSFTHIQQTRRELAHLQHLTLFDFLTYIPLFIMVHCSVVQNPLDDIRDK